MRENLQKGIGLANAVPEITVKEGEFPKIRVKLNAPTLEPVTEDIITPAQKKMQGAKTVRTLKQAVVSANEGNVGQMISLSLNSNARRTDALKSVLSTPEPRISIDPSTAIQVDANVVYQIGGFTANNQLLLKVSTQGMRKLSSVIQFDTAVVVESLIFTLDADNNVTVIADSVNMFDNFDVVSFLPNGGVYYVLYVVYAGGGNAAIYLPTAAAPSANEPNDSPFQVPLRHEECFLEDTFDNEFDADIMRLQVTKPEVVAISLTLGDTEYTGQVNLGIYHKTDENGNAVNKWLANTTINVPAVGIKWDNSVVAAKGEIYIYLQYISGNMLNKPYIFSFTPLSKLQIPHWITTGENGITGVESGHHKYTGTPWVIGTFKVIADFSQYASNLKLTETGEYPRIPTMLWLVGQDDDGQWDYYHNSFYSELVQSDKYGYVTVGALLPGPWGNDGFFTDIYERKFDYNVANLLFLVYENGQFVLTNYPDDVVHITFRSFMNVQSR